MEEDKKIKTTQNNKSVEKNSVLKELLEYVITLAVVLVVYLLLTSFVIINAQIPSESMVSTVMKNDRVFGNRLSYINKDPERFDIVIFKYPDNEKQLFIKRIIGLPGETVHIRDGKVYINDSEEPLDDSFINEPQEPEYDNTELVFEVPDDSYFMMGDNRNHSNDSRYWKNHYVKRDKILGKAVLRYWPLTRLGFLK
ncbi:MAG: signal peptidase I [Lachnospiraceae bacterium]|jgi:signal peptidase I